MERVLKLYEKYKNAQKQRVASLTRDLNVSSSSRGPGSFAETDVRSITDSMNYVSVTVDDSKADPNYVVNLAYTEDTPTTRSMKKDLIDENITGVVDKCRISSPCTDEIQHHCHSETRKIPR